MENKYFEYPELLSPPVKRASYSDRTAWLMAKMSKLAYLPFEKDDTELKSALTESEFSLIKSFNQDGTQTFLAKRDSDKMAVLSFRGTHTEGLTFETFFDVFTDLYATMRVDQSNVKTYKGFLLAFQKIQSDVAQQLQSLTDYGLYVTGHSLGGALALIATSEINSEINSDNLGACYTFGSPKVGNEEFDDKIKAPIYRVINSFDVVPFLPFTPIMAHQRRPPLEPIMNAKKERVKLTPEQLLNIYLECNAPGAPAKTVQSTAAPTLGSSFQLGDAIPADKTVVYIYRPAGSGAGGVAMPFGVKAGDKVVTTLSQGGYCVYSTEPGQIEFTTFEIGFGAPTSTSSITVDAKAGQTYYLKGLHGKGLGGRAKLEPVSPELGTSEITNCKLTTP